MAKVLADVLHGRPVYGGKAEGVALCCPDSITGWCGVDPQTGVIIENRHIHRGESIKDQIVLLPNGKGSVGWSCHFTAVKVAGNAPAGWVLRKVDTRIGVATVTMGIPAACDFDKDPFEAIRDGDLIRMDGDTGVVEIWREAEHTEH